MSKAAWALARTKRSTYLDARYHGFADYWAGVRASGAVAVTLCDASLVDVFRARLRLGSPRSNGVDPDRPPGPPLPGIDRDDEADAHGVPPLDLATRRAPDAADDEEAPPDVRVTTPSADLGAARVAAIAVATLKRVLVTGLPVVKHSRRGKRREVVLRLAGKADGLRWASRKMDGVGVVLFSDVRAVVRAASDGRTHPRLAAVLKQNCRPDELGRSLSITLASERRRRVRETPGGGRLCGGPYLGQCGA